MVYSKPEMDSKGKINHREYHRREESRIRTLLGSFRGADPRKIKGLEDAVEETRDNIDESFLYGVVKYDLKP